MGWKIRNICGSCIGFTNFRNNNSLLMNSPNHWYQICTGCWFKAGWSFYQDSGLIFRLFGYFFKKEALILPEQTDLNEYVIKLEGNKQLPYKPIYSLSPVELETLKVYIETNLKTGFIRLSKSPIGAPILFNKKPDGSFQLCINY